MAWLPSRSIQHLDRNFSGIVESRGAGDKHNFVKFSRFFPISTCGCHVAVAGEGSVLHRTCTTIRVLYAVWPMRWSHDAVPRSSPLVELAGMIGSGRYRACHCCGLIHRLPELSGCQRALCVRCRAAFPAQSSKMRSQRTLAATLGALALYLPAVSLPLIDVSRLGHRRASSLISGTWDLLIHGSWFVGGVVLVFSILLPLVKLLLLLELSWLGMLQRRHRSVTYRFMQWVGKWSMMDVLLLALLVMTVKVGNVVSFHFGPAVFAFVLCVVMSMIASTSFDAHTIWDDRS